MATKLTEKVKGEIKSIVGVIADDLAFDEHHDMTYNYIKEDLKENGYKVSMKTASEYMETLKVTVLDPKDLATLECTLTLVKGGQELFNKLFK